MALLRSLSRWPANIVGLLMLLAGVALGLGGGKLVSLGGPAYHLLAGIALVVGGGLLLWRRPAGALVYLALFAATLIYTLARYGLDGWALVPMLIAPTVLLVLVLLVLPPIAPGRWKWPVLAGGALALAAVAALWLGFRSPGEAPTRTGPAIAAPVADAEWAAYGGAPGGGQFQPASAIAPADLPRLRRAWTFELGDRPLPTPGVKPSFAANPLIADGRLFVSTGLGEVIALDPADGRRLWRVDTRLQRKRVGESSRGVGYWRGEGDAPCARRVLVATLDARLIALNAASGRRCAGFGRNGIVDLKAGVEVLDPVDYYFTAPPVIVGDVAVLGSAVGDNRGTTLERGVVRGFDVRTGRQLWSWDPLPRDEAAARAQGWRLDQALRTGAANAWAPLSADPARGLVFVPTSSPSPDYWGGKRLGPNAHANSVVALRVADGSLVWARQLVHHDLWDYDTATQPALATLRIGGRMRDVVIAAAKNGFVFVLDRATGVPLFPIEERAVPRSDVAGEAAAPTQPFPPPAFRVARHERLRAGDAWGLTPIDQLLCAITIAGLRSDGVFTPPARRGSVVFPGYAGGVNWGGITIDPARGVAVMPVMDVAMQAAVLPRAEWAAARDAGKDGSEFAEMAGTPFGMRRGVLASPFGAPCVRPPWGRLVAIDLANGRVAWQRRLGTTGELLPIAFPFGSPVLGGASAIAGGVTFVGGSTDAMLRAFDTASGRLLWQDKLPSAAHSTPSLYAIGGRQYLAVSTGGGGMIGGKGSDAIVAYALADR